MRIFHVAFSFCLLVCYRFQYAGVRILITSCSHFFLLTQPSRWWYVMNDTRAQLK